MKRKKKSIIKSIMTAVLTVAMVLGAIPLPFAPGSMAAHAETDCESSLPEEITDWSSLQQAMCADPGAGNSVISLVLKKDITPNENEGGALEIPAGKTVTLDLNGHVIDRALAESDPAENGNVICVGGSLTLVDTRPDFMGTQNEPRKTLSYFDYFAQGTALVRGGVITGGNTTGGGGGVYVMEGGQFTMEAGSICQNKAKSGIGVYVDDNSSFTMKGGSIFENIRNAEKETDDSQGGGVYIGEDSSFTMKNGSIFGNIVDFDNGICSGSGGGVYVDFGSFTMEGGSVSGNIANAGGGVFSSGSFTMKGGSISGNTARVEGGKGGNGGGVCVNSGSFIMCGNAVIENNKTGGSKPDLLDGGGVSIEPNCQFTMEGGRISGNEGYHCGGVRISSSSAKMSVSGSAEISGNITRIQTATDEIELARNVCFDDVADNIPCITVDGELSGTIGISSSKPRDVVKAGEDYTLSEDILKHFFNDANDCFVYYEDGMLKFDTYYDHPEAIEVPDLFYNGADQAITVSINGKALDPDKEYTVLYSPETPHDAGAYTATISSLYVKGKQVEKTFKILKVSIPPEAIDLPTAKSGLTYNGSALELVNAGSVSGNLGTMKYYSVRVEDPDDPPAIPTDESLYSISVPAETDAGTYYVYYIVTGDKNHSDSDVKGPLQVEIKNVPQQTDISKATKTDISNATVFDIKDQTYTGQKITQLPTVRLDGKILLAGADYTVSYKDNENVGTATVIITGNGLYTGTVKKTFRIEKAPNKLSVKAKKKQFAVKYAKLMHKKQSIGGAGIFKFSDKKKTKGTIRYKLSSVKKGSRKVAKGFSLNKKNGKLTIRKGMPKGTYKIKVTVTAEDENYETVRKNVGFTVKIK